MRKIYAIGVGGSGAKCIESVVFLHALGMFGKDCQLGILLIDADSTNGNLVRTAKNIKKTMECHRLFQGGLSNFMSADLEYYGIWDPTEGSVGQTFEQTLGFKMNDPLKGLLDVLYSPDEREMNFEVGFRGRPPIGSAILGTLEVHTEASKRTIGRTQQRDALERLILAIQGDEGTSGTSVHLFGSLFGGTGASGIPSLAKLISERLGDGLNSRVKINASLLLPYFDFEKPPENEKVFAEKQFFTLNTQAALYYLHDHSSGILDNIYLLGNNYAKKYESKTGGSEQLNEAHFVELYAALAINDHEIDQGNVNNQDTRVSYICRKSSDALTWDDLPNSLDVKEKLGGAVRVAYAWLYNFSLELKASDQIGAKTFAIGAPWFPVFFSIAKTTVEKTRNKTANHDFLPAGTDVQQKQLIQSLDDWTEAFLTWAQQHSQSHKGADQLFNLGKASITNRKNAYGEKLSQLVIDRDKSVADERQDCIDAVKNQLADFSRPQHYGVFGLVHHLFDLM